MPVGLDYTPVGVPVLCNLHFFSSSSAHQNLSGPDRGKHHSLHHKENIWPIRHRESQRPHQAASQECPIRTGNDPCAHIPDTAGHVRCGWLTVCFVHLFGGGGSCCFEKLLTPGDSSTKHKSDAAVLLCCSYCFLLPGCADITGWHGVRHYQNRHPGEEQRAVCETKTAADWPKGLHPESESHTSIQLSSSASQTGLGAAVFSDTIFCSSLSTDRMFDCYLW